VSAGELLTTVETADIRTGGMEPMSSDLQDKHVQCLIDQLPVELPEQQREQADKFITS